MVEPRTPPPVTTLNRDWRSTTPCQDRRSRSVSVGFLKWPKEKLVCEMGFLRLKERWGCKRIQFLRLWEKWLGRKKRERGDQRTKARERGARSDE
ncbi:hypothetical protein FCV25MIE_34499, partial [Fagus crenata]